MNNIYFLNNNNTNQITKLNRLFFNSNTNTNNKENIEFTPKNNKECKLQLKNSDVILSGDILFSAKIKTLCKGRVNIKLVYNNIHTDWISITKNTNWKKIEWKINMKTTIKLNNYDIFIHIKQNTNGSHIIDTPLLFFQN